MTSTRTDAAEGEYDIFLSHAGPDKPWVLTLAEGLKELGLRVTGYPLHTRRHQ